MSFLKAQISFPSNVASIFSAIKHNSPILFLAQTLYTLFKRIPLKCNFLRFLSAWVKIHQIVVSILKRQVRSSSNFASSFIFMVHNFFVNIKLIHFLVWIKGSLQNPNFETLKCSGENLPYFLCHFPNNKSVFLQILHHCSLS